MLLIDSIYINQGGGMSLLKYLVETLNEKQIPFVLLVDRRVEGGFPEVRDQIVLDSSERCRRRYYCSLSEDVSSVFCFGNVPPPIKLNVPVYTYFHNINMLTLADCRGLKQRVKFWLKRQYIRIIKHNTDEWFVQTSNTANELIKNLKVPDEKVGLYPFYRLPHISVESQERIDYIFVGDDSGSKGHRELIEAWRILHNRGFDRTLHLTVSCQSPLYDELESISKTGVRIVNHGFIPMKDVFALYGKCRATVYPSRNESFGLGLIEALESGCDVIASDLPFVHSVCEPSLVFDRDCPDSIADAVLRYEEHPIKSSLTVRDMVDEMINKLIVS